MIVSNDFLMCDVYMHIIYIYAYVYCIIYI